MGLPNSYTMKVGTIAVYFDAILNAEPPDRFSYKFLEGIGFSSSNDRLLIGILKDLRFLNVDGAPSDRYFQFMDKKVAARILAEGIRESYSDLFAVDKSAHKLSVEDSFGKLRTLYKGEKKDTVIKHIAKTFVALCEYADFNSPNSRGKEPDAPSKGQPHVHPEEAQNAKLGSSTPGGKTLAVEALQYHINIVLPDTRDQSVYDAIFKSLRDHLG